MFRFNIVASLGAEYRSEKDKASILRIAYQYAILKQENCDKIQDNKTFKTTLKSVLSEHWDEVKEVFWNKMQCTKDEFVEYMFQDKLSSMENILIIIFEKAQKNKIKQALQVVIAHNVNNYADFVRLFNLGCETMRIVSNQMNCTGAEFKRIFGEKVGV